jgi:hypothetical protein
LFPVVGNSPLLYGSDGIFTFQPFICSTAPFCEVTNYQISKSSLSIEPFEGISGPIQRNVKGELEVKIDDIMSKPYYDFFIFA